MDPHARGLDLNHSPPRRGSRSAPAHGGRARLGDPHRRERRRRRFAVPLLGALSPIVKQSAIEPMSAGHRRDIRAGLKTLRQNPRPLLLAPAQVTRRPRDHLDPAIALIAFATIIMSVNMTVIVHGDIRRIENQSRCYRTPRNLVGVAAVPLMHHPYQRRWECLTLFARLLALAAIRGEHRRVGNIPPTNHGVDGR